MIITVISTLKLLKLGDRIPPKYIVYSGIALLAIGIGVIYRNLHLQITSLELMPGLILMGMGSGLFLSHISRLTYADVSKHEKPEGSGIYNPVQNLGSSLGRAILGTLLIFYASKGIVDGILEKLSKTLPPTQRGQLIADLQEMIQTLSQQEIRKVLGERLPPEIQSLIYPISLEAAMAGMRTSLLIALLFTVVCFLLSTRLPKYPSKHS